eukprot:5340932-Pleurochrysis_carterae.AAC.1
MTRAVSSPVPMSNGTPVRQSLRSSSTGCKSTEKSRDRASEHAIDQISAQAMVVGDQEDA